MAWRVPSEIENNTKVCKKIEATHKDDQIMRIMVNHVND